MDKTRQDGGLHGRLLAWWESVYAETPGGGARPAASEEEAEEFMRRPRSHVGKDDVGDSRVSTVFLVHFGGIAGGGLPLLYETMVFPACEYCRRYCTRAEALAGHAEVVARLRAGLPLGD